MSQEYQKGKGKDVPLGDGTNPHSRSNRPQYVTVGSGSTSESAGRLQALLDNDSGYEGSGRDGINGVPAWNPALTEDRPTPEHSPMPLSLGQSNEIADNDRRIQANAIHQLWYNQHRVALGRSINRVVETLKSLQEMNASWPATYPSVQRSESSTPQRGDPRPGLVHTNTTVGEGSSISPPPRPGTIRRAQTSIGEDSTEAESSRAAEQRVPAEPRLITAQIAQEFSILKLDLKLGALNQVELVHSLEKNSIASLLDGKITTSIKHLLSLRERIEDTSSKVLVTGDLNAGKSAFCNALLRRKVLPEDQQPCTSIFCEVLDARENGGIEEVHAIHKDAVYNRHDESTYDVFTLSDLEKIVIDNDTYTQCKIYLQDVRSIDESLLNNGVVDISIIDAPGLNSDTTKTTAVFARQEEIDVVVFIVSAANHFTQTAKEFIWAAAAEKAYIFIVVNGYDTIRDKERCQKMILEQVGGLSPRTFKESSELVHFVSSNAIPTAPPPPPPGGNGGGGSSSGGDGPGFDDPDPKGKGKDKEKIQDFEHLERSLRRFVLEKRARSKLAPAKTYLVNLLGDIHTLATVNKDVAQSELDRVSKELQDLEPILEASKKAKAEVSDDIDRTIEATCKDIYGHTRSTLTSSINQAANDDLGVPYPGLLYAFDYADSLKEAMLSEISASVAACEEHARRKTVEGVNSIKQLGLLHLGNEYTNLSFKSDVMFQRKRDILAREIEIETDLWDFFDWSTILQRQEKFAGAGMALTVVTAVGGRMVGGFGWIDGALGAAKVVGHNNLRKLIIPGVIAAAITATVYILNQIPHSLPQRLSNKISTQLATIDYVHANSDRISSSVRKVLRFPADNLRVGLQRSVEQLGSKREETRKVRGESEVARKYFGNLINESAKIKNTVEAIDLEGPAPGVAAAYDA
ncbi:p-loop containing nucleoside triphosphate hydrolase [Venustampulla echinocandica]|uniref:p-loop containing nucleoside triphosphate hydrolase n=1 Tax=Venustampulla echinocandica TaxID=2656787 RepID=A0A370TVR6_9HELO|nr:p-loop containing nucleoside triphosphate hydrolase [Venustampulla echinocandica]RDL39620.1 p-loop containing nucleoside triphosphate hydrolase [Venustampulla echinocandica]